MMDTGASKRVIEQLNEIFGDQEALNGLLAISKRNMVSDLLERTGKEAQDKDVNFHYILRYVDEAVLYGPEYAAPYFVRGRIHVIIELFDLARKDLEKVIELEDADFAPLAQGMLQEMDKQGL